MTIVRPKNTSSVSGVWQKCHVAAYALTAALSLSCSVVFYQVLAASNYHCYQYNAVLSVNEWSRDAYIPHLIDRRPWYQCSYCYDAFSFALKMFVMSFVWMGLCVVFGRGGTILFGSEDSDPDMRSVEFRDLIFVRGISVVYFEGFTDRSLAYIIYYFDIYVLKLPVLLC